MPDLPYAIDDATSRDELWAVPDLRAMLKELAAAICQGVPGCAGVGVSVPRGHGVETIFATQDRVRVVDEAQYQQGDGPCLSALRGGEMVQVDDLPGDPRWPLVAAAAATAGFGSALSLPLADSAKSKGTLAGALNLYAENTAAFDEDSSRAARAFTRHAELILRHTRLLYLEREVHAREHNIAATLQRSLLPTLPEVPGLRRAARYLVGSQAEVGGDWYDLFPLPDGSIGIAIGDVMGHSLTAAAAMGELRSVLRSYAFEGAPPGQALDRLDRLVQGFQLVPLATALYARLVVQPDGSAIVRYANAGHPPALLRDPGGTVRLLEDARSPVIGAPMIEGRARPEAMASLRPGSTLLLYTDGLIERRHQGLDEGLDALLAAVADQPAGIEPEALCDAVLERLVRAEPADDIALLAAQLV